MAINYFSNFEQAEELCDKFKEYVFDFFFEKGQKKESILPNFVWTLPYVEKYEPIKACVELCRILRLSSLNDYGPTFFKRASDLQNPRATKTFQMFELYLNVVRAGFKIARTEVSAFCSSFDEEEKERMNEAIHNHFEGCNYSCVAMSVSAAESRLLKLMCLVNPDSKQELEKKTLGQLIFEYVNSKDEYKNIVPEKHEPLLQLCNTYRTFSVHPKKQKITGMIASSILNLAIEFLVDQDTKPEVVKAKLGG